jgi:hypothetical protein
VTCPHCGQSADFKGYRPRTPQSLLGPVRLRRAYYCCGRCGKGTVPWDDTVGLGPHRLTPGAERAACLLGVVCNSFEEAAERVLPEACGLRLDESTVRRAAEDAGTRLGELLEAGHTLGDNTSWDWHKDTQNRSVAYVSADATGVPQQASGGGPAEGRMPYVAAVYNPVPEGRAAPAGLPTPGYEPVAETAAPGEALPGAVPAAPRPRMQARYLAGLHSLEELGLLLRKQAAQVGMAQADLWVALSDGGSGLEDFFQDNFGRPDLVVILDFWHAASYLEKLAKALFPKDPERAAAQAQEWCHRMKHQGGPAILAELRGLVSPRRPAAREAYADAVRYLGNNVHRMDYPYYRSQGWHIGSGAVESACKTVVGQRLKLAGMRWREYGTDSVCHLRALFKSERGQWQAFWNRCVN